MIAIISDIHFGQSNFNIELFNSQMEFFEQQFFPYLKENNIKHVIHCGDFFHNRNVINWLLYNEIKTRFFKWFDDNDIILHMILGNHDLFYRSTLKINSLSETVKEFKNIIVYDKNRTITIFPYTIGMVPWIIDKKSSQLPNNCDILFVHMDIHGFPMTKGILSKNGYELKHFAKYKYVFSGHYHCNYIKDNVIMVGSPYQTSWNDFNETKGFYVLNDNYDLNYIKNTINPKFVKLYYDDNKIEVLGLEDSPKFVSEEEAIAIAKKNYVRLFVKFIKDQNKLENFHNSLLSVSKNSYKIDIINLSDYVEDVDEEIVELDMDTFDIIISSIENMTFEESIDKELLIKISKSLFKEATDEALSI